MLNLSNILEYSALIIGTLGTILWAMGKSQILVSILWLVSALIWIGFSLLNGHDGLAIRDVFGVLMYSIGIRTYLKQNQEFKKD